MKTGIELIAEERTRQVEEEGYTAEYDRRWTFGELGVAGACYANWAGYLTYDIVTLYSGNRSEDEYEELRSAWPIGRQGFNPSYDPIRNLVKAGALIAAEIDRLQSNDDEYLKG